MLLFPEPSKLMPTCISVSVVFLTTVAVLGIAFNILDAPSQLIKRIIRIMQTLTVVLTTPKNEKV